MPSQELREEKISVPMHSFSEDEPQVKIARALKNSLEEKIHQLDGITDEEDKIAALKFYRFLQRAFLEAEQIPFNGLRDMPSEADRLVAGLQATETALSTLNFSLTQYDADVENGKGWKNSSVKKLLALKDPKAQGFLTESQLKALVETYLGDSDLLEKIDDRRSFLKGLGVGIASAAALTIGIPTVTNWCNAPPAPTTEQQQVMKGQERVARLKTMSDRWTNENAKTHFAEEIENAEIILQDGIKKLIDSGQIEYAEILRAYNEKNEYKDRYGNVGSHSSDRVGISYLPAGAIGLISALVIAAASSDAEKQGIEINNKYSQLSSKLDNLAAAYSHQIQPFLESLQKQREIITRS